MQRQSPVETRKVIELVNLMVLSGIGFIPVPFTSEDERITLAELSNANLEKMAIMAESEGDK